jgi:hypothetical protein
MHDLINELTTQLTVIASRTSADRKGVQAAVLCTALHGVPNSSFNFCRSLSVQAAVKRSNYPRRK